MVVANLKLRLGQFGWAEGMRRSGRAEFKVPVTEVSTAWGKCCHSEAMIATEVCRTKLVTWPRTCLNCSVARAMGACS